MLCPLPVHESCEKIGFHDMKVTAGFQTETVLSKLIAGLNHGSGDFLALCRNQIHLQEWPARVVSGPAGGSRRVTSPAPVTVTALVHSRSRVQLACRAFCLPFREEFEPQTVSSFGDSMTGTATYCGPRYPCAGFRVNVPHARRPFRASQQPPMGRHQPRF